MNSNNNRPTFLQDIKNNLFFLTAFLSLLTGFCLGLFSAGQYQDSYLGGAIVLVVTLVTFIAQYISFRKTFKK